KLSVEFDSGHHHQPGDDAAGEENARHTGANDVADAEIFRSDVGAKARAGEPGWARLGLLRPCEDRFHKEGVNTAEAESPEHASRKGAATFARDEHVSTSSAFGKHQVSVLLDDELAPQRNH